MIHSMTGFAVQTRDLGALSLHLELRGVNSRFLDLAFRLADEVRQAEPALRERLGARLARGKVECRLTVQPGDGGERPLALNAGLLDRLADAQDGLRQRFPDAPPLSVSELLRWPGMLADDSLSFEEQLPALLALADAVIDDFVASRAREGDKLAAAIRERVAAMRAHVAAAAPRMPEIVAEYRDRLASRLREAVASLDEDRVRQEVALYAQRIDVAEELTRLSTHLDEVERILSTRGPAGKRLDFLMQELNREANTLASKSPATDLTAIAMDMKVLIEQMREQVQNVE